VTEKFQPLLASPCEDMGKLRYPVLSSPKLDGIRCVVLGGRALSRKLKPIPNDHVRGWVEANVPDGIDGELMLRDPKATFNDVSSAIMSKDGEPDFVFHAFDMLCSVQTGLHKLNQRDLPFGERLAALQAKLAALQLLHRHEHVQIVPHRVVRTPAELEKEVDIHLCLGYEGTMVRDPMGRYKFGRSTVKEGILLKIKPWHDEEATVVGVVELMHNENEQKRDERGYAKRSSAKAGKVGAGKLGTLACRTEDGVDFEIGTGFTDEQRVKLWEWRGVEAMGCIGRQVKFKHLGRMPGTRAPRGPVFLGWRQD